MRVSLLGTLQVEGGHGPVVLGAAKERSLLSALALRPGSVVATDSLIVALWGDEPPATARKTLQTYVWNLRQALGADVIGTDPQGYALHVAPDDVDVCRFRTLVRQGEDALRRSDSTAVRTFAEAEPVLVTALVVARISPVGCRQVDGIVARCGGRSQRPPGTAVFDSPAPALRCARALLQELRAVEPHMAIGIHSSECFRSGAGVHGAAVDVARTLAGRAPPGEIVVSRTVRDLSAAGDVVFEDRGQEGSWDVYGVVHERVGVTSGRAPAAD